MRANGFKILFGTRLCLHQSNQSLIFYRKVYIKIPVENTNFKSPFPLGAKIRLNVSSVKHERMK